MTFEFDFILVGLMQIFGFFVQGCTGFGCTVIAASVTNGLLGTADEYLQTYHQAAGSEKSG